MNLFLLNQSNNFQDVFLGYFRNIELSFLKKFKNRYMNGNNFPES